MSEIELIEYGPGGFDPSKPDGNVAKRSKRKIPKREQNENQAVDRARKALEDNKTFLAIASPTAAQLSAQVKKLTRQTNALIRLLLADLDDVTDT